MPITHYKKGEYKSPLFDKGALIIFGQKMPKDYRDKLEKNAKDAEGSKVSGEDDK